MPIKQIQDLNEPQLDIYARLSEGQLLHYNEPEEGIFIAESPRVIQTAVEEGYEPISFLVEDKHVETQAKDLLQKYSELPAYSASFDVLKQLTGFGMARGMLCAMKRKKLPAIEEICNNANRIVVLENVMNPTNVGAIFRSAAALNMDAILLSKGCSDPLYRRSVRVSMGTVFQIIHSSFYQLYFMYFFLIFISWKPSIDERFPSNKRVRKSPHIWIPSDSDWLCKNYLGPNISDCISFWEWICSI